MHSRHPARVSVIVLQFCNFVSGWAGQKVGYFAGQLRPKLQVVLLDVVMGGRFHLEEAAAWAAPYLASVHEVTLLHSRAEQ
jgi:hypothetical protein